MLGASGQTIVLLAVVPFLVWATVTTVFVIRRRHKITVSAARESGVVTSDLPPDRPLAVERGGAWIGGMAVSWPMAVLELHSSHLVIRSRGDAFQPAVIRRSDIGRLRVDPGLLGASLKVFDSEGTEIDISFRGFSPGRLRRTLSQGGWYGFLHPETAPESAGS